MYRIKILSCFLFVIVMVVKSEVELNILAKKLVSETKNSSFAEPKSIVKTELKKMAEEPLVNVHNKENELLKSTSKSNDFGKIVEKKIIKKPIERTVLVANEITKDMITYKKHWTGHYIPSKFILMVNGQEVKHDVAKEIKIIDDALSVSFDYEFKVLGKVHRAGGRKFEYTVPSDVEKISSTFSWDDPTNLVLNKGILVASKDTSY